VDSTNFGAAPMCAERGRSSTSTSVECNSNSSTAPAAGSESPTSPLSTAVHATTSAAHRNKRILMLIDKLTDYTRLSAMPGKLSKKLVGQIIIIFYYLKECIEDRPLSLAFLCDDTAYCEVTLAIIKLFLNNENSEHAKDLIDVFKFIALTLLHKSCIVKFVSAGLCETLIETFSCHSHIPSLLLQELIVLERISQEHREITLLKLAYLGMGQLLLTALLLHPKDVEIVTLCCLSLGNIALDHSDRRRVGCHEIVDPIITLILNPILCYCNLELVEDALAVWMEMMSNLHNRLDLDNAAIIEVFIQIMQLHALSAMIVSCLCYEIKHKIIVSEDSVNFGSVVSCQSLYSVLNKYSHPKLIADVIDQLLQIIHYMVRMERCQRCFGDVGLCKSLLTLLDGADDIPKVVTLGHRSLSVLHFLFEQPHNREMFLLANGCRVLFDYHQRLLVLDNDCSRSDQISINRSEQQRLLHFLVLQLLGQRFQHDDEYEQVPNKFDLFPSVLEMLRFYSKDKNILSVLFRDVKHIVHPILVLRRISADQQNITSANVDDVSTRGGCPVLATLNSTEAPSNDGSGEGIPTTVIADVKLVEQHFSAEITSSLTNLFRLCLNSLSCYHSDSGVVKSVCSLLLVLLQETQLPSMLSELELSTVSEDLITVSEVHKHDHELLYEVHHSLILLLPQYMDNIASHGNSDAIDTAGSLENEVGSPVVC
jgi:hypothetical protein